MNDDFSVFGLDNSCTEQELKREYHRLCKIHHPDIGGDEKLFIFIQNAYDNCLKILKKSVRRVFAQVTLYDVFYGGTATVCVDDERHVLPIPTGVWNGFTARLTGLEPHRDIFVIFDILQHDRFTHRGSDLYCDMEISAITAILGGLLKVELLTNELIEFRIPPGTQHNQSFRLVGYGLPKYNSSEYGCIIVTVKIHVPLLSDEKRQKISLIMCNKY